MRDPNDAWLIRLPDGRVVRAKSTGSVRRNIQTGRIPIESWVRRAPEEDWLTLEWAVEFTDLVSEKQKEAAQQNAGRDDLSTGAARSTDPRSGNDLQPVGVRGLVDELLSALDSTINRRKLAIAALGGILGGGVLVGRTLFDGTEFEVYGVSLSWLGAGAVLFLIGAVITALLTQMTFVELSRLRPARWHEAVANLGSRSLRVLLSNLLVNGSLLLLIFVLYLLGEGFVAENPSAPAPLMAAAASALTLILEVLLWPVIGLTLLLSPIVVVEECSAFRAIAQWSALLRRHLSRAFFYEALAAALGTIVTLPFLLPVILAGALTPVSRFPELAAQTSFVLTGLALTPFIAYVTVANVFIYLHLRYELAPRRRS